MVLNNVILIATKVTYIYTFLATACKIFSDGSTADLYQNFMPVSLKQFYRMLLSLGPTVFHGKFCQIPSASSQNSAAHCSKIVLIPQLTAAIHLCIN